MKKHERNKAPTTVNVEAHHRHLHRQLDSLERDNHQSLNDVEGLISIALAAQEQNDNEGNSQARRKRLCFAHSFYASHTTEIKTEKHVEPIQCLFVENQPKCPLGRRRKFMAA